MREPEDFQLVVREVGIALCELMSFRRQSLLFIGASYFVAACGLADVLMSGGGAWVAIPFALSFACLLGGVRSIQKEVRAKAVLDKRSEDQW